MTKVCLGDRDDRPDGNVQHVAVHGLTKDDVEFVLAKAKRSVRSRSTGRDCSPALAVLARYARALGRRVILSLHMGTAYAPEETAVEVTR